MKEEKETLQLYFGGGEGVKRLLERGILGKKKKGGEPAGPLERGGGGRCKVLVPKASPSFIPCEEAPLLLSAKRGVALWGGPHRPQNSFPSKGGGGFMCRHPTEKKRERGNYMGKKKGKGRSGDRTYEKSRWEGEVKNSEKGGGKKRMASWNIPVEKDSFFKGAACRDGEGRGVPST